MTRIEGGADALRYAMGHFASGVTVVTALAAGRAHAMTATAVCAVSLDPPLILVCVGHESRFHPAIRAADAWAVSVLGAPQIALARHFSHRGRDLVTQFDGIAHRPAPYSRAPILDGSVVWLDCRTHAVHDGGDHSIVVGELLASGSDGSADSAAPGPLTYYQGFYHEGLHERQQPRDEVPDPESRHEHAREHPGSRPGSPG